MPEKDMTQLRGTLLKHRREVFERLHQFESDWQVLGERDVELEEEAQKADMTSLYDRLDERAKDVIETIDLALCRMAAGSYGICEECEEIITLKRLEAIPETRLCVGCARKYEKKQKRLLIQMGIPIASSDSSNGRRRDSGSWITRLETGLMKSMWMFRPVA